MAEPVCEHGGYPVYLKTGRFGTYLAWNGRTISFTPVVPEPEHNVDRDRDTDLDGGIDRSLVDRDAVDLDGGIDRSILAPESVQAIAAIEAKYPSTTSAKAAYVPGSYQKKKVPRKLTPFILLCKNRKTGEYLLRCSPASERGATVYNIDSYPGDPAKATDKSLLAWVWARYRVDGSGTRS